MKICKECKKENLYLVNYSDAYETIAVCEACKETLAYEAWAADVEKIWGPPLRKKWAKKKELKEQKKQEKKDRRLEESPFFLKMKVKLVFWLDKKTTRRKK